MAGASARPLSFTVRGRRTLRSRSTLLTTLAFGLLGPGIGALAWTVFAFGYDSIRQSRLAAPDANFSAALTAWAYVFCFIPAAVTGLLWSLALRYLNGGHQSSLLIRAVVGALIGATTSAATGAVWSYWGGLGSDVVSIFAPCGAVAGAALAVLFPMGVSAPPSSNNRWRGP